MTENEKINGWTFEETIKTVENVMEVENNMFKWDVLRHLRDFTESFKYELEQYRAIGTVEELKKAKEQFDNINSYANSIALCGLCDFDTAKESVISTIKAMKDEAKCDGCAGCTVWKCDDANIRAKAIDEFAETLKEKYEEHNFDLCLRQNDYYSYSNSCMLFESYIDEIAEQLKEIRNED